MSDDLLTSALEAVRATDGDDGELAVMTRTRVRRTLESRARGRRQLVSFLTMVTILFGGTMSWALSTGRAAELLAAVTQQTVVPAELVRETSSSELTPPPPPKPKLAVVEVAPPPLVEPPPVEAEPPPPEPAPAPAPVDVAPPVARKTIAKPTPVEVLYRRAHELHFHGTDHATTLAAWDAYLGTEPTGRFVVEARYNRALILVRLGRYFEARAALQPYARGEVQPAGYRQAEATQIVERLDDLARVH